MKNQYLVTYQTKNYRSEREEYTKVLEVSIPSSPQETKDYIEHQLLKQLYREHGNYIVITIAETKQLEVKQPESVTAFEKIMASFSEQEQAIITENISRIAVDIAKGLPSQKFPTYKTEDGQ